MLALKNKWASLFTSNFLGIYNDNLLKNAIIFIAISWTLPTWLNQSQLIALVSASLIIPYLFLSPLAGHMAVIFSKKKVFSICKLLEIPVILLACTAFYFQWVLISVFSVFVMGILSCIYSPSKYSLIRDIGGEKGVSFGSGVFEMMAFLGILIGTLTASVISDFYQPVLLFGFLITIAILGYLITRSIKAVELPENKEEKENLNPILFLIESFKFARNHKFVNSAIFGASAFWFIGGVMQMNLVIHSKQVYDASNTSTGFVMACAAIGIALGCWAAGKISGKEVKRGLILVGLIGMSLIFFMLTFIKLPFWFFVFSVFLVAFMGGIFQIPCLSMLQNSNLGRKLGNMVAYLNLITFVFVLFGTLLFSATTYFTSENSFAVFGLILTFCLIVSAYFIFHSPLFWKDTLALFQRNKN